ncbi:MULTISPECIES: pyridoxamine 5'-phosphate oxidase family protein [Sutcliffiella]|uniref:Phosphohydrolase n=1 Tax=Sutcliffiella cohnii TaxID=33932 RepID=A0A223KNZ7_9BACI|nr:MULTISPECIES: pyridoxamine 5'-phosphate oxidase family protein [Sutcliffiella]AST91212.1 phosphohydrolase [Sutcliffiella cohnii]WBL17027.1 pyridoxamine 5'-phosphate oxidase family protein [Sutcliffiella sp. NC1]
MMKERYQFQKTIETEEELRSILGYPSELVKNKVITYLDHHCKEFISKSPFVVMSTADKSGSCDVSPRGDQPGFVQVLSEQQLIIPERPGNKRMDSMRNILSNPNVGLIFLIPGLGETLRVNGKAKLVMDDELLDAMAVKGKKPLIGIGVEVEECFIHCAKAFKRSGLWEPSTWTEKKLLPSPSKILFEHAKLPNTSVESIEERLVESYSKRLY